MSAWSDFWKRFGQSTSGATDNYGEDATADTESAMKDVQDKYSKAFSESGRRGSSLRSGLEGQGDVGMQQLMKDESFTAFMEGDETDMDSALADRMKAAGVDMTRFGKQGYGSLNKGSEIYKGVKKNDLMAFLEQSANPISAMGEVNAMDPQGTISTDVAPLGSPEETQKDSEAFNAMIKKRKKTGAPPTVGDLSLNNPTSSSVKRI